MSKKKSILLALITPIVLQACNSTSDYSSENEILQSNLTPMATYFKDNVFNKCDEEITIDNYSEILRNKKSKAYGSPYYDDECIPISFNIHEPDDFYENLLKNAKDENKAKKVIENINIDGLDSKRVIQLDLKDGRLARFVKFTPENDLNIEDTKSWKSRDIVINNLEEFFFLHELFHATDINHDRTIPQNVKETLSDIATVITLSTKKEYTIDKSIDLAKEVYHARFSETKTDHGSGYSTHFNEEMIFKFIKHLKSLEEKNDVLRAFSLADAAKMARDIAYDEKSVKRANYYSATFYWSEEEELKKTNKNYSPPYALNINTKSKKHKH